MTIYLVLRDDNTVVAAYATTEGAKAAVKKLKAKDEKAGRESDQYKIKKLTVKEDISSVKGGY